MALKLYVIPGSHPCACVETALRVKGLEYDRVDLLPGVHVPFQRVVFGKRTVPGLRGDGWKVVGSRQIVRKLEELRPEPALLPTDPGELARVEEAERFGDEVLQPVVRSIIWPLFRRSPKSMRSYAEGSKPIIPIGVAMLAARPVIAFEQRLNRTDAGRARSAIAALPGQLDQVDRWVADGCLGGERPNAADLQIGAAISLLLTMEDVAPLIEGRSCRVLTDYFPRIEGHIPAGTAPPEWLSA